MKGAKSMDDRKDFNESDKFCSRFKSVDFKGIVALIGLLPVSTIIPSNR
jgi:hypothetical protein